MSDYKLKIQTPDEAETVFYEAFMHGDKEVMKALWAEADTVCVHPGSDIIYGYAAVVRSWQHILSSSRSSQVRYSVNNKTVSGDLAVHMVTEEILENNIIMATVIATNVYQKFEQGWLMTGHHGSLVQTKTRNETLQ